MPSATATVTTNTPSRGSTPSASAASAPVNATCDSASAVNTWARSTRKYPTRPQASATAVPARKACWR